MYIFAPLFLKGHETEKAAQIRIPVVSTAHATLVMFAVSIATLRNITPALHSITLHRDCTG